MTTETTSETPAARVATAGPTKHHHTSDPLNEASKVRAAITAVDALGLDVQTFTITREWIARADQLASELVDMRAADEAARAELVEALVDGAVTADEAAARALELARVARAPHRETEAGHDVLTAAADLALTRAVRTAKAGEADEAMTPLRAEIERVAAAADQLPVPSGSLAAFGYTAREGAAWEELGRLLDRWEEAWAAGAAVRQAVQRDAMLQLVRGGGGMHEARPVDAFLKVPQAGWELPVLDRDHVLARASEERVLRNEAARERAVQLTAEQSWAALNAAKAGGKLRPGMPGSNSVPPLGFGRP